MLISVTSALSVRLSVCVQVRKTLADIFHTRHIKVQILDLEHRRPQQSCWKRHSPIYKQGSSDWIVLQEEQRKSVCGWTSGRVGVGSPSAANRARKREREKESGGSHFTQVTAVVRRDQLGVKVLCFPLLLLIWREKFPPLLFTSPPYVWERLLSGNHGSPSDADVPAPFKSRGSASWPEWSRGAVMVPPLCQWS